MIMLEVDQLHARWSRNKGTSVAGHRPDAAVSVAANSGEWIGLVGRNGVGKSTLLHAIAGTAPFGSGRVTVGGVTLEPRNQTSRMHVGVEYVAQDSNWLTERGGQMVPADIATLARAFRQNPPTQAHVQALLARMASLGWIHEDTTSGTKWIDGRLFDLALSIACLPRVLLLDEVMGIWEAKGRSSIDRYQEIRSLAPQAVVIVVDHDVDRVLAVCDRIIWLHTDGSLPITFAVPGSTNESDTAANHALCRRLRESSSVGSGTDLFHGHSSRSILWSERTAASELQAAACASCGPRGRSAWKCQAQRNTPFVKGHREVRQLSGGQRVVLAHLLLRAIGERVSTNEVVHLDRYHREMLRD